MGFFSFQLFEIMFFLMFALVFGVFIFVFAKGISQWSKNNAAGWRYVGYVPTEITNHGRINAIDLVFEKDI